MINQELLDLRYRIRHSAAHVMADVVTKMFPEAKLAIGPPTEDGFYYDFLSEKPFTEEDLEAIESEMRKIIQDDHQFIYSEYDREELIELNRNEPLKLEVISGISQNEILSTFKHGDFEDLCAGPHVESTSKIVAFKLLNVAGVGAGEVDAEASIFDLFPSLSVLAVLTLFALVTFLSACVFFFGGITTGFEDFFG